MNEECPRCQNKFTREEMQKEFKVCHHCFLEDPKWWPEHNEIQKFMHQELGGLRKMVTLSRKGKYRKQASGFHIVTI